MDASAYKDIKRSSKTKTRKSRALLAETPSHQQRIIFQPSVQAEQVARTNKGPGGEITAVPQALLGDEEVPATHMIPQVVTRSRSKRTVVKWSKNQNMKGTRSDFLTLSSNSWLQRDLSPGRHNHFDTKNQILGRKN